MLDAGILSVSEDINIFYKVKIKKSIQLSSAQSEIAKKILIKGFNVYLLDGVTGSGKTAIYLDKITIC